MFGEIKTGNLAIAEMTRSILETDIASFLVIQRVRISGIS